MLLSIFFLCCAGQLGIALADGEESFEGRITATFTRGGDTETLLYTVGTNQTRIERGESGRPAPVDILNRASGELTLLFPNNSSFVRTSIENQPGTQGFPVLPMPAPQPNLAMSPGMGAQPPPAQPQIPRIAGPTNLSPVPPIPSMPPGIGPPSGPLGGAPPVPAMPMMPPPPMVDKMELNATTDCTNLLGYPCIRYELKHRGEVMEIWATDKLVPFQLYMPGQPRHSGLETMREQWGDLLRAKKLFPLLAILRFEMPASPGNGTQPPPGPERMRFEVRAITPEEITDETLFQPPPDYQEIQPLPF